MSASLISRLALSFALVEICWARFFQDGFDHHYVYKAESDFLGTHNVTTIMKFHVRRENKTEDGHHLNTLWLDSFVQFTQAGQYAENPLNWTLSRPFLFTISPNGSVYLVHVHPDEETEVSSLKKVLSSTFSVNVMVKNDSQWTYRSKESDHLGTLSHEYTGTRTEVGIQLRRYHRSVEDVERIHQKTMNLDNSGTVQSVEAEDNIILENRLESDFETKRIPGPDEYIIKSTVEGDVGKIKANAVVTMKLVNKRRSSQRPGLHDRYHGLQPDNLLPPQVTEQKKSLLSIQDDITAAIECSHRYDDKSDTNRTICVNKLREMVTSLREKDYVTLAGEFLSKVCEPGDTRCKDEHFLFVDIVARAGDDVSQRLVIDHVFQADMFNQEAVRRALIHFTTLEKPVWDTVSAVDRLCFGENNEHHGSVNMTLTVQRACLALGVLAKSLSKNDNDTGASKLVDKLHSWLYKQGDETPDHLRPRRSTINVDNRVSSDHLLSKFVLLHSLGNAAHPSSIPHLKEYAIPNARIPAWRRAALMALKYDKSYEGADVMVDSLTYDQVETVRATAMEHLLQHPLHRNLSKSIGDVLLSQNYNYPTVLRLKRAGDLNQILLEFKVELPSVHWGYSVGNAAIGASFGVDMVNKMHLRIKPLSGFFHINIWDRVFAEAHIGLLGIRVDILRIEVCYKGKLEYNLNILKDFSYGEAQREFDEYDQMAGTIVTPIVNAVQGITGHFQSSSGSQSVFQPLTDSVKDIPAQAGQFFDASIALVAVLDRYQGLPLLSRARQLAFKLQALAEDIKGDALNFYNEVADTTSIVLPHAETQITEASNMIVDAQKKLGTNPKQAFETINMAKERIKRATYQIIKAKSTIQDALSPHGGSLPTWISSQEEIKMMTTAAESLLVDVKAKQSYFLSIPIEEKGYMVDWQGLADIQQVAARAVAELENLAKGVKPFHSVVTDALRKAQAVKLSIDELDKKTKETQKNVHKIFGPKFNKKFPAQRREADSSCHRGVWPSTTGGRYNDTPGIDVIVEEGWKVICPVNGKVFRTCNIDEIRITPIDADFKMYTIFIRNLKPIESIAVDGSDFKSGQLIGHGGGNSGCGDPYIHLAMRKTAEKGGLECSYVDPSSYVDNIQPFPKWQEECKEFVFKHIGNVIEAGLSGLGFEDIVEELAKRAMAWVGAEMVQHVISVFPKSTMAKMAGTMTFAYLSQYNSEIANAFMTPESQTELMEKKCDEMKTDPPKSSPKPNMTAQAIVGNQEVNKMIENLQANATAMDKTVAEIQAVMDKLKSSSAGIQLDDMTSMAFNKFGKILNKLGIPSKGSKQSMETTLQLLSWKVCPTFENGIAQGYGHVCIPSDDCLALNCTIRIPNGIRKEKAHISVLFNRHNLTFIIISGKNNVSVPIDDSSKAVDFPGLLTGFDILLLTHSKTLNVSMGKVFQLTLSAVICDSDAQCLSEIHIFHNLTFLKQQQRQRRSATDGCSISADVGIANVGHVGGSMDIDKNGHVSGGGIDLGVQVKNVDINGGFHADDKGQWGASLGADVDLGDGNNVGADMYLKGDGDKVAYGAGVVATIGDKGSIGGFVEGNSDGEITAGMQGQVSIGSTNVSAGAWIHHDNNGTSGGGILEANIGGKGHISASLNASSDGTIDAGIGGSAQIGNTTIQAAGYVHHDKNGTSGGGVLDANFGGQGHISASLNASSDGTIDAGIGGSAQIGNTTIQAAGYVHHDKNGTSGGGVLDANFGGQGHISASLNASSDGTIDAGIGGSAQIGNTTIQAAGYVHHDKNGTSGGGVLDANFGGQGHISASLNASSDGTIDAGIGGSAQTGNTTIQAAGYVHHDKNGTSGGGVLDANFGGQGHISASLNASSDGTIDAGIGGSAQTGNKTIQAAGYVHHDRNGTNGGGVLDANFGGQDHISASLNASSDGTIDAGIGGSAQIGNTTIQAAGYVHHDKNGTSGGGVLDANFGGQGHISASLNASSDGTIDAGIGGSAQTGNMTIQAAGYVHHDKNGTNGGGVLEANFGGQDHISASLNASSDGTIDAGIGGSAQLGNTTIQAAGYVHHDKNGTSGGGVLDANFGGQGHISASLNASSDGTIDAGIGGSAQTGNTTIQAAGYVHHDKNGTNGGGVLNANFGGQGHISASLNASSDGTIDAGIGGSAQIGNTTIQAAGYVHHDKNGTSGGGVLDANFGGQGHISASLNASSDGTIDAGIGGSAQTGNTTIQAAGYVHHDKNGTNGGGVLDAKFGGQGHISASLNASSDGTIDAGIGGSAQTGNTTIQAAGYVHHDKNGTSGGGVLDANFGGQGHISASLNASSDGTIDAGIGGSAQTGNTTIQAAGYVHHDRNGTNGGGVLDANFGGQDHISASLNASSDGTIDAGIGGSAQIGNTTIQAAGYVHHDKNGTSGGGVLDANFGGQGHISASLNASSDGTIDAGIGGSAQTGNTTIQAAGYVHHDKNGTSGGGVLDANFGGQGHISASLNASSDGTIDAGIGGSAQTGNTTIQAAGYVHHDRNGTNGGGVLDANFGGQDHISASLNASSDGTIDAEIGGSAQIGNTTIQAAGYVHHDKNCTSGGGVLDANFGGQGHISASLNASSDGTIDAGIGGSAQTGNKTIQAAGYVHHDKNGTSGGGVLDANFGGQGHISASLNASSDGIIDAGIGGSAQTGNTTIQAAGYVHHDRNGTNGGAVLDANFGGQDHISASLNASSDGIIDAEIGGSAQLGNTTIQAAGYVHHDKNGTSGGGVLDANFGGQGHLSASLNASSDGTIDAGIGGSAQTGNTTIQAAGYVHRDKNGTNGGGVLDANFGGQDHIAASLNSSSDGTIDAEIGGSAQLGNTTIQAAGYVHHDKNGTSGGGVLDANFGGQGHLSASLNASSDGTIDAGIGGSARLGNTTIQAAGYVHHDKNGTSGGGVLDANFGGPGNISASLNASSDGTVDAGIGGSAQIGNTTIQGAGYVHHDKNGTSGGGVLDVNFGGQGHISTSLNASSDGTIDAGIGGSAQIGNTTIEGAGYIHHDKNGTSGGGVVDANINGQDHISASLNASTDGTIDAGIGGSAQIGNTTIQGAGYVHHDTNGTSGGGVLDANFGGQGHISASLNASSNGTIDAGIGGSAQIGNTTIEGAGYVHLDKNGTSGGGVVDANINGQGHISASLNASSDGTIDAGIGGSAQIGNTTIQGAGYVHHDKNGTSGGGVVDANFGGQGHISASLDASSDGTVDAGIGGSAQIGNTTVEGAGYVHHDKNGTSGGGVLDANFSGQGQIFASLNASSDGTIDAGIGGSAQIGNTTIEGAGYIHHDKNGTSGGGVVDANINGQDHISASLNASSDGTIDAGIGGSAQIGNTTIQGAGYVHHDTNGTSGGGVLDANFGGQGHISASLNASSNGTIDAGIGGLAQIGNTTIQGAGYVHHDKNGTIGGGVLDANIGGQGHISASLNASTDGTIYAGIGGSAQIGNITIQGAGYVHHDINGTSGGGVVDANINGQGHISASLNASSDGTIDAGIGGSAQIGNTTIQGAGYVHHDKNGTSGGGVLDANLGGQGHISASLNASSGGTIDAGIGGSAQIENTTIQGAGYVHHDKNGTNGGGVLDSDIGGQGQISASLNASTDGTIDAGIGGSAQLGNTTIQGAGYVHHDKNGTSGGGVVDVNINGQGHISASLNASSDGTIDAGIGGSAQIGNTTIQGAGYVHHDKSGTSGGGVLDANLGGQGHISASLNASSDGTIDAGADGSAQIRDTTIQTAGSVHHDKNGTSGGGVFDANMDVQGQISVSLNASSDGTIDAGIGGAAQIANTTIQGAGYVHHDRNGTSGGAVLDANVGGQGRISASLNASSDGIIDAEIGSSAQTGNSTIQSTGYLHHNDDGTSGGSIGSVGNMQASINRSVDGIVSSGLGSTENETVKYESDIRNNEKGSSGLDLLSTISASENILPSYTPGLPIPTSVHHVNVRSAEKCSVGVSANLDHGNIDIGAEATIPGVGTFGAHASFKDGQLVGEINIGEFSFDLGDVQKLSMDTFNQLASDFNIKTGTTDLVSGVRDGVKTLVCTSETEMSVEMETEFAEEDFPARDRKDGVVYSEKHIDITIFKISHTFGVGPIGIKLSFGAGGAIGSSMWSDIQANKGTAGFSISPWVSGMVWGGISIELGIASGGIKLTGYILKTKFPVTMETKSNKHPLTVVMNIDLELTPIELNLRAWAKVFGSKVFDKCLWKWACEPITWNILRKELENKDEIPPQFVSGTFCGDFRNKRDVRECSVKQIPNRHPTDTAYHLEVVASDEDSTVTTWYAIGYNPGGKDVQDWTKFKGTNQVVPAKLPNGVPLYFTVKARNEQGLESFLQCHIDTFDNTPPVGRVEASHKISSHPSTISSTVIVIDDSPITTTYKALGLSPGEYGRELENWDTLLLSKATNRPGVSSDLKYFSVPRAGRLIVNPIKTTNARTPEHCARECIDAKLCDSFDYEQRSETCNLQSVMESHDNKLHISGDFRNYERLGGGYTSYIEYENLPLEHGTVYYVNTLIENSIKYRSALFSEGTLVDFTPPETAFLGSVIKDVIVSHRCSASSRQRCEQVTDIPNHRMVIDGPEGKVVFNGNKPLYDEKYTLTNHYVSANWDGFADPESGLWGFAWAVGTNVCGHDIVSYVDPHRHISSPKYWTYSGFQEDVGLPDGQYYVTVEALNNVVFGGALVTTVCHSIPFTVDTTPPLFHQITDVMFDEDFDILAAYYNVSDGQSGIARVDFGLGMTKHDVGLRAYGRHDFLNRTDPYLVIENLELKPGIPAWVRLRAVNNVGLFASGHADAPIMVDKTPPIAGAVFDGDILREDIQYQYATDRICAQWMDFFDPESGIRAFIWGVGTHPELDDVVAFKNISRFKHEACESSHLEHNVTYYSTVIALNDALNSKRSNASSDGVLVDTTAPLQGYVHDRNSDPNNARDVNFSSETATVKASWYNFSDPESDIANFDVNIEINNEPSKSVHMTTATSLVDHSLTLKHMDFITVQLSAFNGAKLSTSSQSNGFLIDHTPPNINYIHDTKTGNRFQSDNSRLSLEWDFTDPESSIGEYRYQVNELNEGVKTTIFPNDGDFQMIYPKGTSKVSVELEDLQLKDGALYKLHIIALNKARLSASHDSDGVVVDVTPPIVSNVKIAMPKEEEHLDETDTYVHLAGPESITVSWLARDSESDIEKIHVGVGISRGDTSVSNGFKVLNEDSSYTYFGSLNLQYYNHESSVLYYVSVKAVNKAGIECNVSSSKPIKVLHENVPGTVYDGRDQLQDIDFTRDKTSLGISFAGFESETCNIVGYEWAIGSEPFLTDFLPFTDYGIVMLNESHGQAQIHLELYESQTYYATVRARTGEMCKQQFILSASNGITLDTKGPEIILNLKNQSYNQQETTTLKESVFQQSTETIDLSWHVADVSGVHDVTWSIGNLPENLNNLDTSIANGHTIPEILSLKPGTSNFVKIQATDKTGITSTLFSPAVIVDNTVPLVKDYACTQFISDVKSIIGCKWSLLTDNESPIISVSFGIGSTPLGLDILNFTDISTKTKSWKKDVGAFISKFTKSTIYMSLRVLNAADKECVIEETAIVDNTAPLGGEVIFVTRDTPFSTTTKKLCQTAKYYVELKAVDFEDNESGLDRYELGLGSRQGEVNILKYTKFDTDGDIFIDGLQLTPGTTVFASIKVFNKVNLYSTHFSEKIVISPSPKLSVVDGTKSSDEDFCSNLHEIQGSWKYSDPCPVQSAEWAVEDLMGNLIQDFKPLPNVNTHFYNDELKTENGQTYINIIRTVDALNRTRIARSDGLTFRIQPPNPGYVRDGLESDDINYQRALTELSGNWDDFGDTKEQIPSQRIIRYEVALGNDRRFPNARTNIHNFIDVGLNNSFTFINLNLTAKRVRYYFTVRAYSTAGSFIEGYSNGIRVGYEEIIKPGELYYQKFQSSTDSIEIGWSNFISDYGIRHYETAISASAHSLTDDTIDCRFYKQNFATFDIQPLHNVGMNTFARLTGLSLQPGIAYFVTILAEDESGSCTSASSGPILVDTTKPEVGSLFINNAKAGERYNFITSTQRMEISWVASSDLESGILCYHVQLIKGQGCLPGLGNHDLDIIQEQTVNMTEVTFYHLEVGAKYFIKLTAINKANLNCSTTTAAILIDDTEPASGKVKTGAEWLDEILVQDSLSELHATLLIARNEEGYLCPLQNEMWPNTQQSFVWHPLTDDFSPACVTFTNKTLGIEVRTDDHILTEIVKGGVQSGEIDILEGSYTFRMVGLRGKHMISSVAIAREMSTIPEEFSENIDDFALNVNDTNDKATQDGVTQSKSENHYGAGFLVPGYQLGNDSWYLLYWVADRYHIRKEWITVDFDPTTHETKYDLTLKKENKTETVTWQVIFKSNDREIIFSSSLKFGKSFRIYIHGYNREKFIPDVKDIFNPFYSEMRVVSVLLPSQNHILCKYGKAFYDSESGIREIWAGVSNSPNETENVMPYVLQRMFCLTCKDGCQSDCDPNCNMDVKSPLEVIHIALYNLTLLSSSNVSYEVNRNISSASDFDALQTNPYFINIKMVDFAGHQVETTSGAVIVDDSPPEFVQLSCVDPVHSMEEPALYQGTNSSVGAFWDCKEDISQIQRYTVCVGTSEGTCDIQPEKNIGLRTSILVDGLGDVLLDGETYFVTVTSYNEANLKASESCNITVELAYPKTKKAESKEMFSVAVEDAPPDVSFSDRADRLGVQWDNSNNDTEFFEWEIGSTSTSSDIFPRVKIGTKNSKKAAVIDGHLWLDDININTTVKEYVLTNWTEENIAEAKSHGGFFNIEPGRCVHIILYAVNRAHLSSKIHVKPICIKRKQDILINLDNQTVHTIVKFGSQLRKMPVGTPNTDLSLTINGSSGGLIVGLLGSDDLEGMYGSAASDNYIPYIASPLTQTETSRLLRKRLHHYSGLSFYAAPTGRVRLSDKLEVSLRFNATNDKTVPTLIYWDQVARAWRHVTEDCTTEENVDYKTQTYTAKVCLPTKDFARRKRRSLHVSSEVDGPRQFSLVFISKDIVQTQSGVSRIHVIFVIS